MNIKYAMIALGTVVVLSVGGYALYAQGMKSGMKMSGAPLGDKSSGAASAAAGTGESGKKILYWHDPMVPSQKFDKPGKSPFMDMQLVPVYAGADGDEGKVVISPRVQQNLGIRTALVSRSRFSPSLQAVGSVAYNERAVVMVEARSAGFVERLHVRAVQDPVKKGQPLVELYIPEWIAAQEEYISVKRMQGPGTDAMLSGAKQRMRLVGMSDGQVRQVESSNKVNARMTLTSPVSGIVSELNVREGMTVAPGAPLFRINGLDTVWINAEVPETRAASLSPGTLVTAQIPALPGVSLKGKVSALLPEVNASTRTLKARVEIANPGHRIVPGMFATLSFTPQASAEVLTVPSEAVIRTGTRSVVMLAVGDGRFQSVDVVVGSESSGETEIRSGLEAGQKVVVSGQFLIDSEASLKGTTTRMNDVPPAAVSQAPVAARGKVEEIDGDMLTISHDPIPQLKWAAMTMPFKLKALTLASGLQVGDVVDFELMALKDGTYQITSLRKSASGSAPPAARMNEMDMSGMDMGSTKKPAADSGARK